MNVNYNENGICNVKIEETSCFYFCNHFYKAFKKNESMSTFASILRLRPSEEVIAYCANCQDIIFKVCRQFEPITDSFFIEAKKFLIHYYPIIKWKSVCVIELNCYEL